MHQERQCFLPNEFSSTTDNLILPNYLNKLQNPQCATGWSEDVLESLQGFGMTQQIASYWKDMVKTGITHQWVTGQSKSSQQNDSNKFYISALRKNKQEAVKK